VYCGLLATVYGEGQHKQNDGPCVDRRSCLDDLVTVTVYCADVKHSDSFNKV